LATLLSARPVNDRLYTTDQFRVCFNWTDAGATEVEITDYH
jgi:plasmid maintenance system killer protein